MLRSYEAILDHDRVRWQGDLPDVSQARVIVTILESTAVPVVQRRQPSPMIAGQGRTVGDLVEPFVDTADWDCLK